MKPSRVLLFVAILLLGLSASAALTQSGSSSSKPATTAPGSPGDNCSHGSNTVPCRPDPSTNGKDCEDHGNAKGNEDHCATTTTGTTTPETTTTNETTTNQTTTNVTTGTTSETTVTTPTTPTTTTPSTSTPSTSTPGTTPGTTPGETTGESTTSETGTTTPTTPATPPTDQTPATSGPPRTVRPPAGASATPELPYTGVPLLLIATLAALALLLGLILRKRSH